MTRALVPALLLVLAAAGCGGDSESESNTQKRAAESAPPAVNEAGCEVRSPTARTRVHTADIDERIEYDTNPPTTGKHFQLAAEDGIYDEAPPDSTLVHSHEHGRVVIWVSSDLPKEESARLRALVEEDDYQMLFVPRAEMPFEVAATAWNRRPGSEGTGRLMGCPKLNPKVYKALQAFRDKHRGQGPEAIP